MTYFVVWRKATTGAVSTIGLLSGSAQYKLTASTGDQALQVSSGSTINLSPQPAPDTEWHVTCIVQDVQSHVYHWQSSLNDPNSQTAGAFSLPAPTGITFGNPGGGATGWDVRFRAVLPYAGVMTDSQIRSMMVFLSEKYHVTLV